ncbi:PA14 domain-containing protein, partial [Verrucomicrobia bacterium]|nr:PA14 domain-containing protein [Verrucomicrobiota bacterium]
LAEYKAKTGDASLMPILQRGAELMANRIQWWRQPPQHENGYAPGWNDGIAGMTGHGGVVGDYIHSGWGGGINMVGAHLFCGLGLAKRAGVDMSVRPRDGHYFGYDLHPGDNIPPEIATALPASIDLPRGCEDPITGASKIQNPFWYDMTLDQKFWLHWDCITRSTGQEGNVGYHFATSYSTEDAGGRTPSALFGFLAYTGKDKLSETDQKLLDKKKEYIILQHDRHLQAHAYNMGGSMFMALSLPYLSDRDQRYFLDNWKFFYNLSRQPDGSLSYVRGRDYGDAYQDYSLVALLNTALPRSIAIGGLPHVPGYETNRIFARFRQPLLEWPTPEARQITLKDSLITKFEVDLLHAGGETLDSNQITAQWSVLSGPATVNIFTTPESLSTMAQFSGPGIYRLQLVAKIGHLNTTEVIDVFIPPSLPDDWEAGVANYEIYENIAGTAISDLTSATNFPDSPDKVRTLSSLEGDQRIVRGGSRISGYLIPPATGKFVFHVASDDASELRLNPTPSNGDFVDDEAGLALIASVPNWTDARQWGKYAEQQSDPIHLEQGKRYRFEALQKENGGADHISIGWTLPNVSKIEIIGVTSLAIPLQTERSPAIVKQPINQAVALGDKVAFTLLTEGPAPALYQWRLDGVNYLTPTVDPTLTINNVGAGHVGVYDCVYTAGDQVLISQTAALKITNPEFGATKSGGLWQEVWEGIRGGAITDLTSDSSFPRFSDASSLLTGAETSSLGDKYGQRWTGWITPDETADYRFYVTSDDACELRLSNDQTQANLDLISSRKTWCNARAWETVTPSDWLPLVAGQRYYLEMLHKEGGGGDHCAITWQKSGAADPINGDPPIDGAFLSCRFGGPPNVQKSSQAVTIEVSGGVFSDPFYTFTIDGTLLDRLNGSHFKAGSAYEFKAKGISLNHPFTVGVSRDSTHSWITGGALTGSEGLIRVEIPEDYQGSITYYCTAHTSMTKAFKVGEADVDAFTVSGKVTMLGAETSTPLAGVTLRLNQDGSESDTMSDVDGKYSFNLASGAGIELTAGRAHGEGASTGVDVVDIVEMRKHILGRTPFGTLRKVIAGDTNRDASVDVVDIVNVRNVILGRNDYFSEDSGGNKESYWRFVDGDYLSVGVVNAFSELPKYESIIFSSLESDVSGADFTGIKLGDVNGDWYDANSTTLFSQNTMNSRGLLSLSAS